MYRYLGNTGIKMYDIFNFISILVLVVMNMSALRTKTEFLSNTANKIINHFRITGKCKILTNRYFIAFVEIFLISLVQYGFVSILTTNFGNILGTGKNYFGVLLVVPILLMFFFYAIKIPPLRQMDMIAPAYPAALIFVKIACFCSGCCRGIEYANGFFNEKYEAFEFPVQLLEAALALIILFFLLCYRKKAKEGTLFPIYLILYSATRFFSEFLRGEENIFLIFKTYHILCLLGVIIGIFEYIFVLKYKDKINALYAVKSQPRIRF